MSGGISTLPQYAFMARCPVKAQGQLYLYLFTLPSSKHHAALVVHYLNISSMSCFEYKPA
jgi:hypothetical protein